MAEKLGILLSGSGTTAAEVIRACKKGDVELEVGCVIASNPQAGGIEKALNLGIPKQQIAVVDPNTFRNGPDNKVNQEQFGLALLEVLLKNHVGVVSQNGWLPLTPKVVVDAYADAIFNQHPGPKYETRAMHGTQVIAAILLLARNTGLNRGTEIIVHRVTEKFDDGAIVGMKHIDIPDIWADPKELQQKILPFEHILVKEVLQRFANGTLQDITTEPPRHFLDTEDHKQKLKEARRRARELYPNG